MNQRYFYGKILLFGEYSILAGSDAAVIPYKKVKSRIGFFKECKQPDIMLQSFHEYLAKDDQCQESMDLSKFERDIHEGLSIESDIPMNKGLGSSGAVCASIYYYYRIKENTDAIELRNIFSRMESWFHGKSSGIDPFCIYYGKTLVKRSKDYIIVDDDHLISKNTFRPFLIDTCRESETRPLVEYFREQLANTDFAAVFTHKYIPLVNLAVEQWMNGYLSYNALFSISNAQLNYFQKMIPDDYLHVWNEGLMDRDFALKLCGSGGGGMLLGFTADMEQTRRKMDEKYGITIIPAQSGEQAVIPDQK